MNREAIYAAFFSRFEALVTAGTFATASRDLAFVEEVAPETLPSIYQNQTAEEVATFAGGGVAGWVFDVDLYVYTIKGDEVPATTPLNALNDAVMGLLGTEQEPGNFTVSGAGVDGVQHAVWINGTIRTWEGILGNRCVTRIPVRIYVPYS